MVDDATAWACVATDRFGRTHSGIGLAHAASSAAHAASTASLRRLLADPAVYSDPAKSAKVPSWQKKLGELERMLEEAEEEWLRLEAELEEAEGLAT